jgi:3',5'-cyclic AMP phosphodiesterase CpdA
MELDTFDFILTTGDNAYDNGDYSEFQSKVFQVYENLFSRVPIYPTLGNHDYKTNSGAPYLDFFDLPQNAWRSSDVERYYSFDYANVHFVALDSNIPLDADDSAASDDMYDWLHADLGRTTQTWKIIAFHHAPYSTGPHGTDERALSRLVPILEKYGVDLVFNGHDHIYERSQPLHSGRTTTPDLGGIVYIVSGAGSAASYSCSSASWVAVSYCSKSYGLYARLNVNGNALTVEAVDENGQSKDTYVMNKVDTAVTDVSISGPTTGLSGGSYPFTATAGPIKATLPLTYVWQATGQSPITNTGGLANSVTFTWSTTATHVITITTMNSLGTISQSHHISIRPIASQVFIPILVKD